MTQYLFYLVLVLLPFSTRQFIDTVIPGIHEYEAIFLYASDFLILIFLLNILFTSHKPTHNLHEPAFRKLFLPLYAFIFCALISVYVAPSYALANYGFIRLALLVMFAIAIPIVMRQKGVFNRTMVIISLLALLQAGVGIYQFSHQQSLGLGVLGEPQLVSYGGPTSTIPADGGRFIRSYGTFPHPNIYGAFLVIGLLAMCYLYLLNDAVLYKWRYTKTVYENFKLFMTNRSFYLRLLISAGMFVIMLGLLTSFSRGAWLAGLVAIFVMAVLAIIRGYWKPTLRLLFVLCAEAFVLVSMLAPIILPRAELRVGQPAVDYRLTYNQVAFNIIEKNPFGVGIGNQVLYSVDSGLFRAMGLTHVWEWEPIHNLYLLIGSEIGLVGLLSFLGFLAIVLWHAVKHSSDLPEIAVLGLLVAMLTVGLFDHFLWTIQPGRLMLWLAIGLALSHFTIRKVWFLKEKK